MQIGLGGFIIFFLYLSYKHTLPPVKSVYYNYYNKESSFNLKNNIFNVKIIEKCNCYHIKEGYFMI